MSEIRENEIRNLIIFFSISYIISWSIWFLPILFDFSNINRFVFYAGGVIGPCIGAYLTTLITKKGEGVKILWRRVWSFDFEMKWLIPTIFLIPFLFVLLMLISGTTVGGVLNLLSALNTSYIILWFILYYIAAAFEEVGWRGYALDRLQLKTYSLFSSIILGLFWGLWHLPLLIYYWFWPVRYISYYLLFVVLLSILFAFLYNNTRRNIFIVTLFHTLINMSLQNLFPIGRYNIPRGYLYLNSLLLIINLILIIIYGPKHLSRNNNISK